MHSSDGPVQSLPAHDMRGVGPARHWVGSTFLETSSQSILICLPPNNTNASSQPPEPLINELTEGSGGERASGPHRLLCMDQWIVGLSPVMVEIACWRARLQESTTA